MHIPFCSYLCHYCDFAKTALFDEGLIQGYFRRLQQDLELWLTFMKAKDPDFRFDSVFLGGGTPGLFAREYEALVALWTPWLRPGAEVSLEANPDNITPEALRTWKGLGWNRLSLGVQSFQSSGLQALTRQHGVEGSRRAIDTALAVFPNLNIDLIYGWPGQSQDLWHRDLSDAVSMGLPHLSLYTLTYESRTPIGRRQQRGLIRAADDEELFAYYRIAQEQLLTAGYEQEEVSNWSKPGFSCRHNWLYWQDQGFLAIGAGATGYIPAASGAGIRYRIGSDMRAYARAVGNGGIGKASGSIIEAQIVQTAGQVEVDRDTDAWILEYVGSSLRTRRGVDMRHISAKTGRIFQPRPALLEGLKRGLLSLKDERFIVVTPEEWFRETSWSVEVSMSFFNHSIML